MFNKSNTVKKARLNPKFVKEFDARIYLKKSKFDKMSEEQKDKAAQFLSDFQIFINAEY
jgi:hypothetical protein